MRFATINKLDMQLWRLDTHNNDLDADFLKMRQVVHGEKDAKLMHFCTETVTVFYFNYEFHVLIYNSCLQKRKSNPDFMMELLEAIAGKVKVVTPWTISKSHVLDRDLRDYRYRGIALRKFIWQACFVYAPGKTYAIGAQACPKDVIASKAETWEFVQSNDRLISEYKKVKEYLKNAGLANDWVSWQVDELYHINRTDGYITQPEIVRTVNHLITQINKQTNEKHKQSQQ